MRISHLFRDPALRAAFARIERDASGALVLPKRPEPVLNGGAALRVREDA
ncbi:hypothetical protein [Jiella sonneratiae]|uniref:Uncharacterized protein n=1 Tax=Jiella sonneratiae TaxID=2816856 RepID=A0ABS3J4E3_9HYPH|nr:hypothetical protein [Jiella sonneratiae]MBO0903818.1 hypothetical protein [Jiella sonneratiae]